jgi:hypothetical protein
MSLSVAVSNRHSVIFGGMRHLRFALFISDRDFELHSPTLRNWQRWGVLVCTAISTLARPFFEKYNSLNHIVISKHATKTQQGDIFVYHDSSEDAAAVVGVGGLRRRDSDLYISVTIFTSVTTHLLVSAIGFPLQDGSDRMGGIREKPSDYRWVGDGSSSRRPTRYRTLQ